MSNIQKNRNNYSFYCCAAVVFLLTVISIFLVRDRVYDVEMCLVRFSLAFIIIFCGHFLFFVRGYHMPAKKTLWWCGILLCIFIIGYMISALFVRIGIFRELAFRFILFVSGSLLITVLIVLYFMKKIPDFVLLSLVILIVGSIYAFSFPDITLISWDDQTHYERCVIISHANLNNALLSDADSLLINSAYQRAGNQLPNDVVRAFSHTVNETYLAGGKYHAMCDLLAYGQFFTYLPSAIVLLLSRGLCLPYSVTFTLGRWANTILYALLMYFALKRLKTGKLILFIISMFPTSLLLMSNYSYDTWGLGFTILAFSLWLEVMQNENMKITMKKMAVICLFFALSCAAKPIYFLMMLVFFLTPKTKIDGSLPLRTYRVVVVLVSVLLAASFIIPYLSSGVGGNDYRGGSEVNSAEQIHYILSHPLTYSSILLKFLKGYWLSGQYIYLMAYLGNAAHSILLFLPMLIVCFLDKGDCDKLVICIKSSGTVFILAFVTSAFIASIMYIGINPVGADVINWCQPRYLLPLLPFVAYFLGGYRIAESFKKIVNGRYLAVFTVIYMTVYAVSSVYENCLAVM